jgi:hypothetical protein
VVDHRGDYSSEAQIETQLDGHEHDGKDDPDDGCDESQPIVEQVPRREPVDQRHWRTRLLGVQTDNDEGSKLSSAVIKGVAHDCLARAAKQGSVFDKKGGWLTGDRPRGAAPRPWKGGKPPQGARFSRIRGLIAPIRRSSKPYAPYDAAAP